MPQGRWARHFGIIAWPISHSILPRDLQTHFARLLYDMRFDLARQVNLGVEKVEELLAARDATGSSRFNDLLEQTQLLARVVLALRDEDVQGAVQPIYPPTLARLVSDIGAKRAAREWLKEARRVIRNARFDAAALADRHAVPAQEFGAAAKVASPRLVAKRSGDGSCQIAVALPDLTLLLAACGIEDETLKKSRVRFFDAEGFWPGQAVRSLSNKERQISRLPEPFDLPVLDWKGLPEQYLAALLPHMRLVGQPPWLLRRQEDGLFRQSVTKQARSGQSYLVVAQSPVDPLVVHEVAMEKCVAVPGTRIYAFDLTAPVSLKRQDALAKIGIGYSLRAKVSPLGLLPRWEPHGRSLGKLALEAKASPRSFREFSAVRAIILYPMNALVNDQLGRLRLLFGNARVVEMFEEWAGRPARFARYTSRTPYAGVRMKNKDSDRLASMGSFFANIETAARRHLAGRPLIPSEDEAAFELFEELKSRGKWPAKESVADWYGKSGDRWLDAAGEFKRAVLREHDAELMTRHEVHENAPIKNSSRRG